MMTPVEFYKDLDVIKRILEYCGVPASRTAEFSPRYAHSLSDSYDLRKIASEMTAEFVVGSSDDFPKRNGRGPSSRTPNHLGEILDNGANMFRSMWDRQGLVFYLDMEYVSHKYKGEAYVNPKDVFAKIDPAYRAIRDTLLEYGIIPMTIATGQGYHFAFMVNSYDKHYLDDTKSDSIIAKRLVEHGFLEETLKGKYETLPWYTKRRRIVAPELGRAHDTVGKLLEYVMHKAIQRMPGYGMRIPVGIGDIVPGNDKKELLNLDLSTYASPLFARGMRTVFSIHDKHKKNSDPRIKSLPITIAVPRLTPCNGVELDLEEVFKNRQHFRHSANYARAITTEMPECSRGVMRLLEAYLQSDLYQFHRNFDETRQDDARVWHRTYDKFDLGKIPPCVARALVEPNPYLLQPAQIQTLVRVLTGKNWWHPSHVAGLIRSKYEKDYGWHSTGLHFSGKMDANRHARVWVRFYAGMLATGIDQRVDQNCVSHQEKGMCIKPMCGYNLGNYR